MNPEYEVLIGFSAQGGYIPRGAKLTITKSHLSRRIHLVEVLEKSGYPVWITQVTDSDIFNCCTRIGPVPVGSSHPIPPHLFASPRPGSGSLVPIPCSPRDAEQSVNLPPVDRRSRCECGADACGSPGHSKWCPKFMEI